MIATALRLLFIGNSLTAANDLPATVAAMARAAGVRIECTTIARPNFSLEDHWNDGAARRAIARGGWTFVVLQQGPSALPESRVQLDDSVRRFDVAIRAAGAKTALLMVWPSRARSFDFSAVSGSYAGAAALVGGVLFPAGDVWRAAWAHDPALAFYGDDGFHPSPLGSAVAAAAIVRVLIGRPLPGAALASIDKRVRAVIAAAIESAVLPAGRDEAALPAVMAPGRATAGFR
jgi:hypothetical protein